MANGRFNLKKRELKLKIIFIIKWIKLVSQLLFQLKVETHKTKKILTRRNGIKGTKNFINKNCF